MEKHEFMSPAWIEMAREQIVHAFAGKDLRGIRFTLCEAFTDPPAHLRVEGSDSIGFFVRVADGAVEVGDHPIEEADLKVISDYDDALAAARVANATAAALDVMQERSAAGRLSIEGNPNAAPPVFTELNIHELLAPHTA